jgi:hypothetical protein
MAARARAGSGAARHDPKQGCLYGFLGVFVVFGLAFAAFGAVPLLELWRAQDWTPTPCTILTSQVREFDDNDGSTWRVDVTFRYEFGGVEHVSDRYRVSRVSSSGRAGKQRVVDSLPPGTETTCYVDPDDPSNAILRRDLGEEWIFVAAGLLFAAVGGGMALLARRRQRTAGQRKARLEATSSDLGLPAYTATTERLRGATSEEGPLVLVSSSRRGALVLFMAFFATFWNGVSWPLLGPRLLELLRGDMAALMPGLFALVFLPVGLGALAYLGYLVLAWFNPRPRVTLSTGLLRVGSRVEVAWQLQGARRRLEDLTILLEGRKVTTSGGGKDARTRSEVFHTTTVAETGRASRIVDGQAELAIPADVPPSHEQARRATQWVLVVRGAIRSWPDLREEYLLWVHPREEPA